MKKLLLLVGLVVFLTPMAVSAEDNNLLNSHCIDSIHKVGKIVTTKIITKGSVRGETQNIQKTEQIIKKKKFSTWLDGTYCFCVNPQKNVSYRRIDNSSRLSTCDSDSKGISYELYVQLGGKAKHGNQSIPHKGKNINLKLALTSKKEIDEWLAQEQIKKTITTTTFTTNASTLDKNSLREQLKYWKDLYDDKLISKEEYDQKRKELLSGASTIAIEDNTINLNAENIVLPESDLIHSYCIAATDKWESYNTHCFCERPDNSVYKQNIYSAAEIDATGMFDATDYCASNTYNNKKITLKEYLENGGKYQLFSDAVSADNTPLFIYCKNTVWKPDGYDYVSAAPVGSSCSSNEIQVSLDVYKENKQKNIESVLEWDELMRQWKKEKSKRKQWWAFDGNQRNIQRNIQTVSKPPKIKLSKYDEFAIALGCGIERKDVDECVRRQLPSIIGTGPATLAQINEVKKDEELMGEVVFAIEEMRRAQDEGRGGPTEEEQRQAKAQTQPQAQTQAQAQATQGNQQHKYRGYNPIAERIWNKMGWTTLRRNPTSMSTFSHMYIGP